MVNVHVKFESDGAKAVVAIVSTMPYTQSAKSWPWPLTLWPQINRVPPLIIHNLNVKFESDWAKTVVCILSTRSYTQITKVDLDLWPRDLKLIGFLLSSWWRCKWSLKLIGQKLWSLSCPQGKVGRTHARTHPPTHEPTHSPNHPRTAELLYPLQRCCYYIPSNAVARG